MVIPTVPELQKRPLETKLQGFSRMSIGMGGGFWVEVKDYYIILHLFIYTHHFYTLRLLPFMIQVVEYGRLG